MSSIFQPQYYCMYPYSRAPYYSYLQYQEPIQEQNQPTTTYKSEVLLWLSKLDSSELNELFSIKEQIKTFPIMQMYIHDKLSNPSQYALLQQATINLESKFDDLFMMKSKVLHAKEEELFEKLQITDDENFLDIIFVVEPHLENLNQFLELLDELSDKHFLSMSPKTTFQKNDDPQWFHQNSFHSCAVWIIKEFEKNIAFQYNQHRDKKKKNKQQRQLLCQSNTNELREFFMKNLANNKEKLAYYFEQIVKEIDAKSQERENIFYTSIFKSSAIKTLKSQVELQITFQQKCHQDQNIINSMLITNMSDLIEQRTYLLKKFYKYVLNLFQQHLENELISNDSNQKSNKLKKDKKKKKKRFQKAPQNKILDPIELTRRLSIKNLQESNILRFQRSYSQNNLAYQYVTPPNTPSAWENSDDQSETTTSSQIPNQIHQIEVQLIEETKKQFSILEFQSLVQDSQRVIADKFQCDSEIPTNDDLVECSSHILLNVVSTAIVSLDDETHYHEEVLAEKKRLKKKQKIIQKSIPESRDEQLQILSPESEITRISVETQAQTIISHCSNRTESTSEEDEKINQKNPCRMKIKRNYFEEKSQARNKLIDQDLNQFEDCQNFDHNLTPQESEQTSQRTLEEIISPKKKLHHSQQFQKKNKPQTNDSAKDQKQSIQNSKELEEEIQQKGQIKLYEQVNLDIIDFTDSIMKDYEDMLPFRLLAFERIKLLIKKVFYGIPDEMIQLFGSCATGLALIDSDIDIGINGLGTWNKSMVKGPFDNLFFAFSKRKWVTKSNPIFNSIVPVIKLEIDPQIAQTEFEGQNLNDQQLYQWKKLKQKLKGGIKVDISFNYNNGNGFQQSHQGSVTTDLVKEWISQYPTLQQLVLILKTITKKLGLSESFTGGLSSFSLIIMVYSYLREYRNKQSLGEQFIDMLEFYSSQFNPTTTGVGLLADISNPNSSYFFELQAYCLPMLPITIFNPYNKRLLTNSCIHIGKIFDFFRTILQEIESKKQFYCSLVVLGKKKQQKLCKTMDNMITTILETIK